MLWSMLALLLARATAQPLDAIDHYGSLPIGMIRSAERGELHAVVEWLGEGGSADAVCSVSTETDEPTTAAMLHVAAVRGHLEVVRELLERGASVDLQTGLGFSALMAAAGFGHHAIVLLLLQHSANPNLQPSSGQTALMAASGEGHMECVQTLLRAKARPELVDGNGGTALQYAQNKGYTAIARLIRQHASCLSLGLGADVCAALTLTSWPGPLTSPWVALGTIAMIALYHTTSGTAGSGQRRAARQRRPHHPDARRAKAKGRARLLAEPTFNNQGHAAPPPQPTAKLVALVVAPPAVQAERAARPDAAMEELLAEGQQARPKKSSKKKTKAGRPAAARDESSKAPEAALRAAIAGGRLSALEWALAAAPREVREGGVGAEARALCDRLLEAQQEAQRLPIPG